MSNLLPIHLVSEFTLMSCESTLMVFEFTLMVCEFTYLASEFTLMVREFSVVYCATQTNIVKCINVNLHKGRCWPKLSDRYTIKNKQRWAYS